MTEATDQCHICGYEGTRQDVLSHLKHGRCLRFTLDRLAKADAEIERLRGQVEAMRIALTDAAEELETRADVELSCGHYENARAVNERARAYRAALSTTTTTAGELHPEAQSETCYVKGELHAAEVNQRMFFDLAVRRKGQIEALKAAVSRVHQTGSICIQSLIKQLAQAQSERERLKMALLELPIAEYYAALRDGCDHEAAWAIHCDAVTAHIRGALLPDVGTGPLETAGIRILM